MDVECLHSFYMTFTCEKLDNKTQDHKSLPCRELIWLLALLAEVRASGALSVTLKWLNDSMYQARSNLQTGNQAPDEKVCSEVNDAS